MEGEKRLGTGHTKVKKSVTVVEVYRAAEEEVNCEMGKGNRM